MKGGRGGRLGALARFPWLLNKRASMCEGEALAQCRTREQRQESGEQIGAGRVGGGPSLVPFCDSAEDGDRREKKTNKNKPDFLEHFTDSHLPCPLQSRSGLE